MRIFAPMSAVLMLTSVVLCQSQARAQAPESAVLAFDIALDRLMTSEAVKSSGVDPNNMVPPSPDDIKPEDLKRVFGAVSAPDNLAVMEAPNQDESPVSFFVRAQFKDPAVAKKMYDGLAERGKKVTLGGKEYCRPPEGEPQNMLAHMFAADTVQFGTDDFVMAGGGNVFSAPLLASWKKMPKAAVRVAVDVEGARHLINEAKQKGVPPQAMMAVSIVDNLAAVRLGFDLSSSNLLWLTLTGKDEQATATLKAQLDGLLAMAQGFGKQGLAQVPFPKTKQVAGELLDAMKAQQDGNDVNLELPRPSGFEEAVAELGQMIPAMMMGGAGGPGGQPGAFPQN